VTDVHDAAPSGRTDRVVICVPTYRRPKQLARLLMALAAQRGVGTLDILIGNNEGRDLSTYPELCDATLPAFRSIQVATRGVSAVRNAMIAEVLTTRPDVRWIACLDDDQLPSQGWLAALLAAGERFGADLVGGPVTRTIDAPTFWSHGAADTSYLPTVEGPTATLNEAGNLLLSTGFLHSIGRPPFSLEYGRTGGEDYEFFLHAKSRGARIVWAPGAQVDEPLPQDRLTLRSYAWRFYAIAAYQARADRRYHGAWHVVRAIVYEAAKTPAILLRSLIRDRDFKRAIGIIVQYAASVSGRLIGLFGVRAERYARDTKKPAMGR
jgi:succinoglycan biosynthesis protein ExoM